MDTVIKCLNWNWTEDKKSALIEKFNSLLGYRMYEVNKDKLIINKKYRLFTIHPLEAVEAKSASIVNNVYDRLSNCNEEGNVTPGISHYYELNEKYIDIYLRPNVTFQDGTTIDSDSIINCIENAREHPNTSNMLKDITDVIKITDNSIRVYFDKCPHILYILSHTTLSIYKVKNGLLVGTGPYKINKNNEYSTILERFDGYYGVKPFIHTIELLYVHDDRYMVIGNRNSVIEKTESIKGFYYLCKNKESKLSNLQLEYIKYVLYRNYRYELNKFYRVSLEKPFILNNVSFQADTIKNPGFHNVITIDCIVKNDLRYDVLKNVFNKNKIPIELIYHNYEIDINKKNNFNSDFLCFGEFIDKNEVFGYYNFIFNEQSIPNSLIKNYGWYKNKKEEYLKMKLEDWKELNNNLNNFLWENNILFLIYNNNYQLYYESGLMGISVNEFGFVDLTKIWKKRGGL